ncbi:MAG: hypothetical protein Fur0042_15980 [Cyanophyceae cyanobacterium]
MLNLSPGESTRERVTVGSNWQDRDRLDTTSQIDDVYTQACGGSIAAIVQILNERLAPLGLRTRAVLEGGILQLLCEARSPDLDREPTVERVQRVLEELAPRGIQRVQIYARLVEEQQLLWLAAIRRDPDSLLWSCDLRLKRSNWFYWTLRHIRQRRRTLELPSLESTDPTKRRSRRASFGLGVMGGAAASLVVVGLAAWQLEWFGPRSAAAPEEGSAPANPAAPPKADAFAQAVRLAEQAVIAGQDAQTPEQWRSVADRWNQAADLMATIPPDDPRHRTAQDRQRQYRNNGMVTGRKAQGQP